MALYLCQIHPTQMKGRIIVQTPIAVGGIAEAPELGELPVQTAAPSGGSSALLYALAGACLAALAAAVVGAWFSRRRGLG